MPRDTKRKKPARGGKGGFGEYAFVEVRLREADKANYHKWTQEVAEDAVDLLSTLVNSGYKVSLSWSDYNDCYTASVTGTEENGPNYQLVMTSRSDDLWDALMIALFKHFKMFGGDAWPTDKQTETWG